MDMAHGYNSKLYLKRRPSKGRWSEKILPKAASCNPSGSGSVISKNLPTVNLAAALSSLTPGSQTAKREGATFIVLYNGGFANSRHAAVS